jgi:hypothetical protein
MKDVYRHSTIKSLASVFAGPPPIASRSSVLPPVQLPAAPPAITAGHGSSVRPPVAVPTSRGKPHYVLCGMLQLLFLLGYSYLVTLAVVRGAEWISAGTGFVDLYTRSGVFGAASFVGLCALPILAKWMLIGRWKPRQIRVWSLAYFRFWIVKTLVRSNPLVLFVGSPLHLLYLRALGAKVGRGVAIFSPNVPVCTDLLTIGDGTVIRS